MKIVDRKTFMQLPKGTVFCKFPRFNETTRSYDNYVFGITEPYVKMDDTDEDDVDFCAMGIGSDLRPAESTGSSDYDDILTDMERNPGKEVAFEYSYGRDGMYEGDEVGFAIFSRAEVELMIKTLQDSLATAYSQPSVETADIKQETKVVDELAGLGPVQFVMIREAIDKDEEEDLLSKIDIICPNDSNDMEKQILRFIVLKYGKKIIEDRSDEQTKLTERKMYSEWMDSVGTYYRDFSNKVTIDRSGEKIKVTFEAHFIY